MAGGVQKAGTGGVAKVIPPDAATANADIDAAMATFPSSLIDGETKGPSVDAVQALLTIRIAQIRKGGDTANADTIAKAMPSGAAGSYADLSDAVGKYQTAVGIHLDNKVGAQTLSSLLGASPPYEIGPLHGTGSPDPEAVKAIAVKHGGAVDAAAPPVAKGPTPPPAAPTKDGFTPAGGVKPVDLGANNELVVDNIALADTASLLRGIGNKYLDAEATLKKIPLSNKAAIEKQGAITMAAYSEYQTTAIRSVVETSKAVGSNTPTGQTLFGLATTMNEYASNMSMSPDERMGGFNEGFKRALAVMTNAAGAAGKPTLDQATFSNETEQLNQLNAVVDPLIARLKNTETVAGQSLAGQQASAKDAIDTLGQLRDALGPNDPLGRVLTSEVENLNRGLNDGVTTHIGGDAYLAAQRFKTAINAREDLLTSIKSNRSIAP